MPLLSSSKKAEEFARLLDGSSAGGGSSELGTLGDLAQRLSAVPQPRAEFASALRSKLMSEATAALPTAGGGLGSGTSGAGSGGAGSGGAGSGGAGSATGSSAASSAGGATGTASGGAAAASTSAASSAVSSVLGSTAPLWAQLAAGAAATTIAISGVSIGASRSLPGDFLYGVKRQFETIQLDLAGGTTDTAVRHLDFARARLNELGDLLSRDGTAGQPLSADLQKRIQTLLTEWAGETSQGTTVLLNQLSAAAGDLPDVRATLVSFTDNQARDLAVLVQQLPDANLQSLTGSAFAYLQRIDTALGNPVDLARLLPSLGLDLPTAASTTPQTADPSAVPTPGSSPGATTNGTPNPTPTGGNTPTSVPTLPIPADGQSAPQAPTGGVPTLPKLPKLPSTGGSGGGGGGPVGGTVGGTVGGAVGGTVGGAQQTVDGVLNGVTGKGPALPLPTTVPKLPGLSR